MIDNINPLDWHNTKFLTVIPEHFVRVKFRHNEERLAVLEWLQNNTRGRFAIGPVTDSGEQQLWLVSENLQIGFENPAEATMYSMFFQYREISPKENG